MNNEEEKDLEKKEDQPTEGTEEKKVDEVKEQSPNKDQVEAAKKEASEKPEAQSKQEKEAKDSFEKDEATKKEESPKAEAKEKYAAEKTDETSKAKDEEDKPKRPARKRTPRKKKDEEPKEETPSPKQPLLDHFVKVIESHLGKEAIVESYINRNSKDLPTIITTPAHYLKLAKLLKNDSEFQFDYLSDLHGIDFETHMEIYVYVYSMEKKHSIAFKVKIDRENPVIDSLTPVWEGANWPECEAYDLLGITFTGHPNLKRILLGEDWQGYPLRKDYEPYDVEV